MRATRFREQDTDDQLGFVGTGRRPNEDRLRNPSNRASAYLDPSTIRACISSAADRWRRMPEAGTCNGD